MAPLVCYDNIHTLVGSMKRVGWHRHVGITQVSLRVKSTSSQLPSTLAARRRRLGDDIKNGMLFLPMASHLSVVHEAMCIRLAAFAYNTCELNLSCATRCLSEELMDALQPLRTFVGNSIQQRYVMIESNLK